jgi:hypothetical protein
MEGVSVEGGRSRDSSNREPQAGHAGEPDGIGAPQNGHFVIRTPNETKLRSYLVRDTRHRTHITHLLWV